MPSAVPFPAEVTEELNAYTVTPGLGGFFAFFFLALASWLLYRSFAKHMRRVQVRANLVAEEQARLRAAAAVEPTEPDPGPGRPEPTEPGLPEPAPDADHAAR